MTSDSGNDPTYITVGELSVGFSENVLAGSKALAGKSFKLYYESGARSGVTFLDGQKLRWEPESQVAEERIVCDYRAVSPRENIYFVDFVAPHDDSRSVSIVLDLPQECATIITAVLPTIEEVMVPLIVRVKREMPLTSARAVFEHAAVDRPFTDAVARHERTADLVGERIQWVYSSRDAYEHIYLEENTYSWHCIAGKERGWQIRIAASFTRSRINSTSSSGRRRSFPQWGSW
jgi:hypothetical protein